MSNARHTSFAPRAVLLLTLAAALSACGSTIAKLPEGLGGLPESAPQRPAETMPFPQVYEVRPTRGAKPLNDDEQKKLESELTTLRDNQNKRATEPPPPPAKPTPKTAAKGKAVAAKKPAAPAKKDAVPPLKLTN
jgi:hypothetical protein